jgi:hypothetical protein
MELIKKYWWVIAGLVVYMMMGKKKRKPRRRRNLRSMRGAAARMVYRRPMQSGLGGYRSYAGMKPRRRSSRMRRR